MTQSQQLDEQSINNKIYTIEFLSLWKKIKNKSELNCFTLNPKQWMSIYNDLNLIYKTIFEGRRKF
jgi:hypothetical protein